MNQRLSFFSWVGLKAPQIFSWSVWCFMTGSPSLGRGVGVTTAEHCGAQRKTFLIQIKRCWMAFSKRSILVVSKSLQEVQHFNVPRNSCSCSQSYWTIAPVGRFSVFQAFGQMSVSVNLNLSWYTSSMICQRVCSYAVCSTWPLESNRPLSANQTVSSQWGSLQSHSQIPRQSTLWLRVSSQFSDKPSACLETNFLWPF